jgi:hypothetical protein
MPDRPVRGTETSRLLTAGEAVDNATSERRRSRYPHGRDARVGRRGVTPAIEPKFQFEPGATIFTIGSCFARNIEDHLAGYDVPTLRFSVPPAEWPSRPNCVLNEYNAGTIAQRIERAFSGAEAAPETVLQVEGGFRDLLLPTHIPVTWERAFERRAEIDALYAELPEADVVVVTLGLVEAWIDTTTGTYITTAPPRPRSPEGRFELQVMDVDTASPLLEQAIGLMTSRGINVIVTVSPVPLYTTFSGEDAIVANTFSKAVLRVCASRLARDPHVDYFPAYEMVLWEGRKAYEDDNIHVRDEAVERVTRALLAAYAPSA